MPSLGPGRDARGSPATCGLDSARTLDVPLLVVHDGPDPPYAAPRTVLDNLIHPLRRCVPDCGRLLHPRDRLTEYTNSTAHSRFLTQELVPRLETQLPLMGRPSGRCLMGSSLGGVASLSAAVKSPGTYGSPILMSGSFVFTDIGTDHGGGPVFDPVVKFVNRYRARPTRVADRVFMSAGIYEPLIVPNRSMVPTFESTGMTVRFVETRDGHSWENWRDTLRDALSWVYPGAQSSSTSEAPSPRPPARSRRPAAAWRSPRPG